MLKALWVRAPSLADECLHELDVGVVESVQVGVPVLGERPQRTQLAYHVLVREPTSDEAELEAPLALARRYVNALGPLAVAALHTE